MNQDELAKILVPEVYEELKKAVEIGKWPDGNPLSQSQKEYCMQAIIHYEFHNLPEHERTGYIPPKKTPCAKDEDEPQTIKWDEDPSETK